MRRAPFVVLLVAFWALVTGAQIEKWRDPLVLWAEAAAQAPAKPRPLVNLGVEYARLGRADRAEACYRRAIALAEGRPAVERQTASRLAERNRERLHVDIAAWLAIP